MLFSDIIAQYNWKDLGEEVYGKNTQDVVRALNSSHPSMDDFKALVSPAAAKAEFLEEMARQSRLATQQKFGKTIQFYIPLYLSNACTNHCIYCGFNHNNKFKRVILTDEEILEEAKVLKKMGYEHVLLLTGESPKDAGVDYIEHAMQLLQPHFAQLSLEVQPLETDEYARLRNSGLHAVYTYQETYNKERYPVYHPGGKKRDYNYRVNTQDRLGMAGVHKIGIGALLGLEDWRVEAVCMAMHLLHLEKTYWKSKYAIAFPRMRPHEGGFQSQFTVDDKEFVQLLWAFRIFDPNLEVSLTTRESNRILNAQSSMRLLSRDRKSVV